MKLYRRKSAQQGNKTLLRMVCTALSLVDVRVAILREPHYKTGQRSPHCAVHVNVLLVANVFLIDTIGVNSLPIESAFQQVEISIKKLSGK